MKDPIKEIAIRLQGLRESLELTPECLSDKCGLNVETYMGYDTATLVILMRAMNDRV